MSAVRQLLQRKGSHVYCISEHASVLEAARLMNEHRIGALMVVDDGRLVGIFTERDILQRVVAEQREPASTPVSEVMTTDLVCCRPETTIEEARGAMKNRRLRHLPVIEGDGTLIGLVSIGDLNAYCAADNEYTIHLLQEYLHGRM
ncbi:MAG: CBS domain-containing protein [Gemmataceae bacterium]